MRVLLRTDEGCALMVEMGNFRALLLGGVVIMDLAGKNAAGPSVLLLSPADLGSTPPEVWQALGAQMVLSSPPGGCTLARMG